MWAIYYADGTRVMGQSAAEWRAAPSDGVQVVVMYELDAQGLHSRYGSRPPTQVAPWAGVLARMAKE